MSIKYIVTIVWLTVVLVVKANAQTSPIVYQIKNYPNTSLQARVEVQTGWLGEFILDKS